MKQSNFLSASPPGQFSMEINSDVEQIAVNVQFADAALHWVFLARRAALVREFLCDKIQQRSQAGGERTCAARITKCAPAIYDT